MTILIKCHIIKLIALVAIKVRSGSENSKLKFIQRNMNQSALVENFVTCYLPGGMLTRHETGFKSDAYENNRIINIVFLAFLFVSTMFLNAIAVITIQKIPQLKNKFCYFTILLQSSVDLGLACLAIPVTILYLLFPYTNFDICTLMLFPKSAAFLSSSLSIVVLSGLTMERYLSAVHPFFHRTRLTKTVIVKFIAGAVVFLVAVTIAALFHGDLTGYVLRVIIGTFFIFNTYAYVRIYVVIRKNRRAICERDESSNEKESQKDRRRLLVEVKHAMSCFIVVVSFVFLYFPFLVSSVMKQVVPFKAWRAYFMWAFSLLILNSSINSAIFFWRNAVLRKEAVKVVKRSIIGVAT